MMVNLQQKILVILAVAVLTACGGGGSSADSTSVEETPVPVPAPDPDPAPAPDPDPAPTPVVPETYAEAFRFLNQASMGATEAEARRVVAMGYEAWIDEQLQLPASLSAPYVNNIFDLTDNPGDAKAEYSSQEGSRTGAWVLNAVNGPDQLRQRVALALSEILVVSDVGELSWYRWESALADYYDVLAKNAFGNYRDLLEDVTLRPVMGIYLSMLGNLKPDTEKNIRPDENFARELMQLFTIGLVELNIDGTEKKDSVGRAIPTYTQDTVQGFAHVFTGWDYKQGDDLFRPNTTSNRQPMVLYPGRHDTGAKQLLGGLTLPAGQSGEQDLQDALNNIFEHPNVAPFISLRLIQRLVTSNPSAGYVEDVARVFNDNGAGVKGDLAAVVKEILLHPDARPASYSPIDGKLKEPLLRMTQLWRAYGATSAYPPGLLVVENLTNKIGQGPLQAESVFNFFQPSYAPSGEIRNQQLVAPEMQIITEYNSAKHTSYLYRQTHFWHKLPNSIVGGFESTPHVLINFNSDVALEASPDELINRVAYKLLGGNISDELRAQVTYVIAKHNELKPESTPEGSLTAAVIFLIASSPEYAYQY
jgi:uncharacterized protein (DUF1800 family)